MDRRDYHQKLLTELTSSLAGNTERIYIKKKTVSNLFRYEGRSKLDGRTVDLSQFNQPLYLDHSNQTLEVQGLTTYESILDFVLPDGLAPLITPELKHITVGGATVGIGIETNSYRYGFVHDSLLEADVLLPSGQIVTCSPDNKYADLFYGLPNSYGTLGYILRAKLQLRAVKPYVKLTTQRYDNAADLLASMKAAAEETHNDYVESLAYSKNELYLTTGRGADKADHLTSIYGSNVFYRQISRPGELTLTVKNYLFRYDPEWFWNLPETRLYRWFRRLAPISLRNSSFYTRYARLSERFPLVSVEDASLEKLIQDWEVPWAQAAALLSFVLDQVDLAGKPLMAAPLKTPARATSYPMEPNGLYLNLGSYSFIKKPADQPPYYTTKIIDEFCFARGGIKMLYSSTFLNESDFNRLYGGKAYAALKQKYDPKKLLPTLFEKAVRAR